MKYICLMLAGVFFVGCGGVEMETSFPSLTEKQPIVMSVTPQNGAADYNGRTIDIVFSQPIDPQTLTAKSVVVMAVKEGDVDPQNLWGQVEEGKVTATAGDISALDDGRTIRFTALNDFPPMVRCGVLITPAVQSKEHLPLNQTPGNSPTPFFSSFYAGGIVKTEVVTAVSVPLPPKFLKLSEIFYDAVGSDTEGNLFVELFGDPDSDLAGYQILFVNGGDGKIVDNIKIEKGLRTNANGLFVIADAVTNQLGITKVLKADWVTNLDPPNGPDCVQLVDPEGKLLDAVGYGSPLVLRGENNLFCYLGLPGPDAPNGKSITRSQIVSDFPDNSQDWIVLDVPTPGESVLVGLPR
ncbi:MAG: Ig-like domain-containing protein [Deltaproteobacteria bacterium]|nr:Ig-like domain-containing protein [Deltaproteobacteria bacterium]